MTPAPFKSGGTRMTHDQIVTALKQTDLVEHAREHRHDVYVDRQCRSGWRNGPLVVAQSHAPQAPADRA